jgi:acyl-CoA thioester hydrolase
MNEPVAPSAPLLISVHVSTRWGDMDAYNHVNNSVYATYLEEARLRWFRTFDRPWTSDDAAPVIAAMNINFRRSIEWPAQLTVELFAGRAGRSSLAMPFRIFDCNDPSILYADGDTVLVWTSPKLGVSVPLPDHVRRALPL